MKKYTIAIAVFLLTAGMVNAQTTKKAGTSQPTVKTSHSTSSKTVSSTSPAVTTQTSNAEDKKTIAATKKKKHHKKAKSAPASSN